MNKFFNIIFLILLLSACLKSKISDKNYPRMTGDIELNLDIDSPNFILCNDDSIAVQYYAFTKFTGQKNFEGEKYELVNFFKKNYNSEKTKNESGLIRIRFMVNCKGETGRYRMIGMDNNYKEKEFDKSISNQLLTITRKLKGWKPIAFKEIGRDYYQYLIFKIENGNLIEILP